MPITRTVSEFTSTRKVRYGGDTNRDKIQTTDLNALASQRLPLTVGEEGISQHTAVFTKDENGNDIYVSNSTLDRLSLMKYLLKLTVSSPFFLN